MAPRRARHTTTGTAGSAATPSASNHSATSHSHSPAPDPASRPASAPAKTQKQPRVKEEHDESVPATNGRVKKRSKDTAALPPTPQPNQDDPTNDDDGVTRCICNVDDVEDGAMMIQCDSCKVWQHNRCIGLSEENSDVPPSYYCERCRPDLHTELLKRLKKIRHSSVHSNGPAGAPSASNPDAPKSPATLSDSPQPPPKPKSPKRRSTMNSRDAAYDLQLAGILFDATASAPATGAEHDLVAGRRKRKRSITSNVDPDASGEHKRPRSASSASDKPASTTRPQTPVPAAVVESQDTAKREPSVAPARPPKRTNARRSLAKDKDKDKDKDRDKDRDKEKEKEKEKEAEKERESKDDDDDPDNLTKPGKQPNQHTRKPLPISPLKRTPVSSQNVHEHGTRRNNNGNGNHTANSRPLPTTPPPPPITWGLPDYLSHMAHILPTEMPEPVSVRVSGAAKAEERGVKVKWPGKRITIGDMNKRVRNIMEFIVREQAAAIERASRVEALAKARQQVSIEQVQNTLPEGAGEDENDHEGEGAEDVAMAVDPETPAMDEDVKPSGSHPLRSVASASDSPNSPNSSASSIKERTSTMQAMAELMEDLLSFQQRFRPREKRPRGDIHGDR